MSLEFRDLRPSLSQGYFFFKQLGKKMTGRQGVLLEIGREVGLEFLRAAVHLLVLLVLPRPCSAAIDTKQAQLQDACSPALGQARLAPGPFPGPLDTGTGQRSMVLIP